MKKNIRYRKSRKERYESYIHSFLREKRGVFGFCLLLLFAVMGIIVPILSENGAFPPPSGLASYVSSNNLPPDWVEFLPKSLIPASGNIVTDTKLRSNSWSFNVSDSSVMLFNYDKLDFITGGRSAHFTFVDKDSTLSYQGNARGNLEFQWPYNMPINATLSWWMKINITGDISFSSISPYIRLVIPEGSNLPAWTTYFRVHPPDHSEWMLYKRYLPFVQLIYVFQPNSTINLEFGVDYRYTNPAEIGSVDVWFDLVELFVTRPTHGLLGTNHVGQDIFVQLCYSIQVSFFVAFLAGIASLVMGVITGIIAGYRGGLFDTVTMGTVDLLLIYPSLLIIFLLLSQFQVSAFFLPFLIAIFIWPSTARIIRSRVIVEREQLYIESARAAGASDWYIIFRYILPNILGLIFVQFTTNAATAINIEAGLSFMDYPIQRGNEEIERRVKRLPAWLSWGYMLAETHYEGGLSIGAWWAIIPPGLCIVLMATAFMFIGNALDRVFNPLKFQDRSFRSNFKE
ncbi:MAG: ABC transporter permease [Promethearchaeota archaeon]